MFDLKCEKFTQFGTKKITTFQQIRKRTVHPKIKVNVRVNFFIYVNDDRMYIFG